MLSIFRHKGVNKAVLWFITTIIVLSFAIFGTAYRVDNQLNSAGTMYGQSVNARDFRQSYADARDQAILMYGDQFFKNEYAMDFERETWDRLILLREAKKQRITVSNKDVIGFIAQLPFFQRDGKFDQSLYSLIVKNPRVFNRDTRSFEEGIRRTLMIRRLMEQSVGNVTVSDDELLTEYRKRHEKITLQYVRLNPTNFTNNINPSDDELKKFYEQYKTSFEQPALIKVNYVHAQWPENADEKVKNDIKTSIVNLSAKLTTNNNFNQLATDAGFTVKTSDYFSLEAPLLTFASNPQDTEKLFSMNVGELTKPLEVPDGWQIIQIADKKPAQVPPLADIQELVRSQFISDAAYQIALKEADTIHQQLSQKITTMDFKTAAASLNLTVEETPAFSRNEYVAQMGIIKDFKEPSLGLNENNKLSTVIPSSMGPAIIYLAKTEPINEEEFKQGKDEFRNYVLARKQQESIITFMNKLRLEAKVKSNIKRQ